MNLCCISILTAEDHYSGYALTLKKYKHGKGKFTQTND